ncbi:MAG TPA: ADP-ribosylglycohydrolase family protein [Pyrinomonadaceae bacterium]|nr:ADP-ribosylglycohydrolase family protein [Pyrinomonadaceae bacterium]
MESLLRGPIQRARCSLEGLSVGDAFGETFFINPDVVGGLIAERALASRKWSYTDDTQMALSIFSVLRRHGYIHQPELARSFAERYDSTRGYGPAMHRLLWEIKCGEDWSERASSFFAGQGSFGNGAAMRVAPIGSFFADDIEAVVEHATRSSVITHTHDEAIAGAIAVAVAVAFAHNLGASGVTPGRSEFLDLVLPYVPESEVRSRIRQAREIAANASVQFAVAVLGNGVKVSAQDTVPFALWCAGAHLSNYEEALWLTVSGLGDRDTTCAIVGGIVASHTGIEGIPPDWLKSRERLPEWPFNEP